GRYSVGGLPLVAHAVRQALAAETVHRVVVSTDDAEIAAVARRHGAEVVERPLDLAGDAASSESALLHALDALQAADDYRPDLLVFLQCTAPLTTAEDIDGTVRALLDQDADSALSAAPAHLFLWRAGPDGAAEAVNHDARVRPRRQDREPEFLETGAVYAMRVPGFRSAGHRFFGRTALYVQPPERALEVDEPLDLVHAEVAIRERARTERVQQLPLRPAALVLDFDGVMTDGAVTLDQDGKESVRCHRRDGMGIERLRAAGIPVLVLSKERNPVVTARCAKLNVPCLQGIDRKLPALTAWLDEHGIDPAAAIFLGDDVNDAECLEAVGCGVVVADAHPDVRPRARIQLDTPGGQGAVRELTDLIEQRLRENSDA
ncbi:MAG: acylneuraminate cytidylyltransferase, partial [Acidimicrobiia bacterium]